MAVIIDIITAAIGIITAVATVVLAFITWRYVRLTRDYVQLTRDTLEENRQMRLDTQKPRIAIYIGFEKEQRSAKDLEKIPTMYLYVENIGMGPAYDLEFDTNLDFVIPDKRTLREIGFVAHDILYLPPGQKRKAYIGDVRTSPHDMDDLMKQRLEITVAYKGIRHKECKRCFCLNFEEYESEYRQVVREY